MGSHIHTAFQRGVMVASMALPCAVLAVACSDSGADDDGNASGTTSAASGSGGATNAGRGGATNAGSGGAGAAGTNAASGSGGDSGTSASGSGGAGGGGAGTNAGSGSTRGIYANVVAVTSRGNAGAYTFDVSIESADIDCTQYADWWEVLSGDGALRYRRILTHSHTDENGSSDPGAPGNTFTRNGGPIDIAADEVVLVRAHMSTGGYEGMVMRGSPATGFENAPDIGSDFAADVEDDDPQATPCLF